MIYLLAKVNIELDYTTFCYLQFDGDYASHQLQLRTERSKCNSSRWRVGFTSGIFSKINEDSDDSRSGTMTELTDSGRTPGLPGHIFDILGVPATSVDPRKFR